MTETATHLTHIRADLMRAVRIDAGHARRRRVRLRLGGVFVAGTAVVVAVAAGIPSGGGQVDPAAAAALRRAAITAAGQPALAKLTPGRFYHFTDTETGWIQQLSPGANPGLYGGSSCVTACPAAPSDWAVKAPAISQTWVAADGSGLRTLTIGKVTFRNAKVRADFAAGRYGFPPAHPFGRPTPTRFKAGPTTGWAFGELSLRQVERLPSDPDRLRAIVRRLAQGTDNPLNAEEFTVIGDIMRASPLRPRVRAAFYTILSRLPGITLVGNVTDPLGRPGIEVAMGGQLLIFDPRTAQLLSEGGGGYSGWSVVDSIPRG